MKTLRIGTGAGFAGDRIRPAVDLARNGALDYLVFECLAERTIALAQLDRLNDPAAGYDKRLDQRMRAVLPDCHRHGTRIITNMGAANPLEAARRTAEIAAELGLKLRVAAVVGDDVLDRIGPCILDETGCPASDLGDRLVSANAYLGAEGIVKALARKADIVICGRVADPSLFVAPMIHEFGWALDDHDLIGRGTVVGHLMECGAQVTGGYFADPGVKDVPNLATVGYPIAEVAEDGTAIITKLAGTGGLVSRETCIEQLLYELHDPAQYFQPDVVANFSGVDFSEIGPDRVAVTGGTGAPATGRLKVSVGARDGWIGQGEISYAGPGAVARARLAGEITTERLGHIANQIEDMRVDIIGLDAILPTDAFAPEPRDVRLRIAARCTDTEVARAVADEVEGLYLSGPAGGGGVATTVREVIGIRSTYLPAAEVSTCVHMFGEAG
ncbi:acyclic terpene utilization AtuA family protein [uncultured Roseovarius sp.]|uniref:acyclic terpene utilization AtuA family protein n=1 Tax=uncultured Roseovarius sp. TaxID=293344 RepID=UPI0025E8DFFB|nr:acyclic terpene utilization AtuA family protein [uncultured Roseovarius sp.]